MVQKICESFRTEEEIAAIVKKLADEKWTTKSVIYDKLVKMSLIKLGLLKIKK